MHYASRAGCRFGRPPVQHFRCQTAQSIPARWLITLFEKKKIAPEWIRSGLGDKVVQIPNGARDTLYRMENQMLFTDETVRHEIDEYLKAALEIVKIQAKVRVMTDIEIISMIKSMGYQEKYITCLQVFSA